VKNVTVSRQGKRWFVALQVEMEVPDLQHPATAAVGMDLGIATFAATSSGERHRLLNVYRQA
jgi:putative transposase